MYSSNPWKNAKVLAYQSPWYRICTKGKVISTGSYGYGEHKNAWYLMSSSVSRMLVLLVARSIHILYYIMLLEYVQVSLSECIHLPTNPTSLNGAISLEEGESGNEASISIPLQLNQTYYWEYSTGQVQDWVNTSCTGSQSKSISETKEQHIILTPFFCIVMCIYLRTYSFHHCNLSFLTGHLHVPFPAASVCTPLASIPTRNL